MKITRRNSIALAPDGMLRLARTEAAFRTLKIKPTFWSALLLIPILSPKRRAARVTLLLDGSRAKSERLRSLAETP